MDDVKDYLKKILVKVLSLIGWLLLSVFLMGGFFFILSFFMFFLLLNVGGFPMEYIPWVTLRVFLLVIVMILYLLGYSIAGAFTGFTLGTYSVVKGVVSRMKIFTTVYDKVFKKLFKDMQKKAYIGSDDYESHKGWDRVSYKETLEKMLLTIDEIFEQGLMMTLVKSPVKWVTQKASSKIVKKAGEFILKRMRTKEKSGDHVIFLDVLDNAGKKGLWEFIKSYLLKPLFLINLAVLGVLILLTALPVIIFNIISYFAS